MSMTGSRADDDILPIIVMTGQWTDGTNLFISPPATKSRHSGGWQV